jgi:hypothetical protein
MPHNPCPPFGTARLLGLDPRFGLAFGVLDRNDGTSLKARLDTESKLARLRSILNLCESIILAASAPCDDSDELNCALKNVHACVINSVSSKNSTFLGGIPSGHSVRARPLNVRVTDFIFAGLRSLRIRVPRRIAGERSVYSWGSKPVRKRTGSERWTETMAEPRLLSVLTTPLRGNVRGDEFDGTSIEFRREV